MLTIDIRLNGKTIAQAELFNISGLADVSDYRLEWLEYSAPEVGITGTRGHTAILGHRRRQSVWALVGKTVVAILGQIGGHPRDNR